MVRPHLSYDAVLRVIRVFMNWANFRLRHHVTIPRTIGQRPNSCFLSGMSELQYVKDNSLERSSECAVLPRASPLHQDVNTTVRATPVVLHHKAELHWNVFGEQPRMFRGTVTRDRLPQSFLPPWLFRPVVSSFVGSGVGSDTADTSYRHRQNVESGENSAMPPRLQPQTDRY